MILQPDFFNGLLELAGSVMLWMNVRQLIKDKEIKGISVFTVVFFTFWGGWNLFYYPHLNQWWSFAGGVSIFIANIVWLGLLFKYRKIKV